MIYERVIMNYELGRRERGEGRKKADY